VLGADGLLVQQSESPLLHLQTILKELHGVMRGAGFTQVVTLQFPVAGYPSGWWSATMAGKRGNISSFRREDAENKPFKTLYYNAAIHQGALAAPEFTKAVFTDQ
jgi:spermidine synthase